MRATRITNPLPQGKGFSVPRRLAAVIVALAVASPAGASHTSPAAQNAAADALTWLKAQQASNGSLGNDLGRTAELVLAIEAAGGNANTWSSPSPVSYLSSRADDAVAGGPGLAGKVALAVEAAGGNASSFGGENLVAAIAAAEVAGLYDPLLAGQAFAVLGLRAAGVQPPQAAALHLLRGQSPDGGWAWTGLPADADTNSTALALQAALVTIADPIVDVPVVRALQFLHLQQSDDAGFPYQRVSAFCTGLCPSDANSTAYVIQAIAAADASLDSAWQKSGTGPVTRLIAMQSGNGSFPGFDAVLATVQAVPGVLGKSFLCIAIGGGWC